MKAIQRELGESDSSGDENLKELRTKLDGLELPDEARKEVEREWQRLQRIGRESMEAQVIRTYLETVAELPWNTRSEEALELAKAAGILDTDHYALKDVKDRVLEFLAVRQLRAASGQVGKSAGETASEAPEGDQAHRPSGPPAGNDDDRSGKGH